MVELDKERREQYTTKVKEDFPDSLPIPIFRKKMSLRYGQNPGNPSAFYEEKEACGPNMSNFEVLQEGKGLGYINLGDMDLGQKVVKTLHDNYPGKVACCIIKHETPSGVGIDTDSFKAFNKAWHCDSLSSFGGVHVFSGIIFDNLAYELIKEEKNAEVIYAPQFTTNALNVLMKRKSLRVVKMNDINLSSIDNGLDYKRLDGGMLVEKRNYLRTLKTSDIEIVSHRIPSSDEISSAIFTWIIAAFTRSNAVVIGTKDKTNGIGSGQRSRIDAAEQSIYFSNGRNGRSKGYGSQGTFMASDAYMPHTDVVELAAQNGVTGIIYPLGSIKDKEVIKLADDKGLAMIITRKPGTHESERAFLHR